MSKTEWEPVTEHANQSSGAWRLAVPGGWIYSIRDQNLGISSVFVPAQDERRAEALDLSELIQMMQGWTEHELVELRKALGPELVSMLKALGKAYQQKRAKQAPKSEPDASS